MSLIAAVCALMIIRLIEVPAFEQSLLPMIRCLECSILPEVMAEADLQIE